MEGIKQWLISLVFSAAAGTLITVVSPKGSNDKTLKTIVGIFIISTVFLPLSEINVPDLSLPAFGDMVEYDNGNNDELAVEMLEEELAGKIENIAKRFECGINEIKIDAEYDEDKCIIIHNITVYFAYGDEQNILEAVSETEEFLGVPIEVG